MDSEIEFNLPVDSSLSPIPMDERGSNRHLYTCPKPDKLEPMVLSDSESPSVMELTDSYDFALKAVYDLSAKQSADWCVKRFDGFVSNFEFLRIQLNVFNN